MFRGVLARLEEPWLAALEAACFQQLCCLGTSRPLVHAAACVASNAGEVVTKNLSVTDRGLQIAPSMMAFQPRKSAYTTADEPECKVSFCVTLPPSQLMDPARLHDLVCSWVLQGDIEMMCQVHIR